MIKPEDLRIGDFVRICSDKCMIDKGKPCEVVGIDAEQTFKGKKGLANLLPLDREVWEISHGTWCQYIEGIPITKEFLEKNEFLKAEYHIDGDSFEWHVWDNFDTCVKIHYYPQSDVYYVSHHNRELCKIAYVHELQNFLASVKENIKITV